MKKNKWADGGGDAPQLGGFVRRSLVLFANPRMSVVCASRINLRGELPIIIGGTKGRQGSTLPQSGSKFFHFHAIFGSKISKQ